MVTKIELLIRDIKVHHREHTILKFTTVVEDIESYILREGSSEHAIKVEIKHQVNQPLDVQVNMVAVLVQWRSHLFYKI